MIMRRPDEMSEIGQRVVHWSAGNRKKGGNRGVRPAPHPESAWTIRKESRARKMTQEGRGRSSSKQKGKKQNYVSDDKTWRGNLMGGMGPNRRALTQALLGKKKIRKKSDSAAAGHRGGRDHPSRK